MKKQSALDVQEGGNHYKDLKIQPVEFIHANNLGFMEGCIVKYVSRYKNKNGLEDLKKARHFIDLLIDLEYPQKEEPKKTVTKKKPVQPNFMRLMVPSPELKIIIGDQNMSRTEAVKRVWQYIKKYNLQNPKNVREIFTDENLKKVFGKDKITMFEMAKIISGHLSEIKKS